MMNLTNGEILLVILVEGSLLAFLLTTILFLKKSLNQLGGQRAKMSPGKRKQSPDVSKLTHLLKESESLSKDLAQNLQDKRELAGRLITSLDEKIRELSRLLEKTKEVHPASISGEFQGPDEKVKVLALARTGCEVPEIARRLGRCKEEVQLILDLEKIAVN